ncbi:MAG: O-antigen ligase family protein [Clostridium sp.]|nr:O-antigen ligase family protein [Clostridium sp.]
MNCLKKYQNYLNRFRKGYIIAFLTYLMLSRIVLFVNIISISANALIYNVFAIVGILLLIFDFLSNFYPFKSRANILLTAFLVTCAISSVVNISYGISDNLKTLVWTAIQFFVLFSTLHLKSKEEAYENMNIIMKISSHIWFVAVVISLWQFVFQIHYRADFSEFTRRQGFYDARLFGIFSDPNFAAVTSLIVIVFCYYLNKKCEKRWLKRIYTANIICQALYIVLSGSRTGIIEAVILTVMLVFFETRNKLVDVSAKNYIRRSILKSIIAGGLVVLLVFILPAPLLKLAEGGEYIKASILGEEEIDEEEIKLDRDDIREDNLSNNRFEIWKSALEVSSDKRFIGVSPRNMIKYAEKNYPDSYIAKTKYEAHNGYVAVIASTGILGTVILLLFIIYLILKLVAFARMKKYAVFEEGIVITFIVMCLVAISAFMLLDIFFVNTYSAAIFWLFTGYLVYFLRIQKKVED